jgi:hypothetical protein
MSWQSETLAALNEVAGAISGGKLAVDIGSSIINVDLATVDVNALISGIAGSGSPATQEDLLAALAYSGETVGDMVGNSSASNTPFWYSGYSQAYYAYNTDGNISNIYGNTSNIDSNTGYSGYGIGELVGNSSNSYSPFWSNYSSVAYWCEQMYNIMYDVWSGGSDTGHFNTNLGH